MPVKEKIDASEETDASKILENIDFMAVTLMIT